MKRENKAMKFSICAISRTLLMCTTLVASPQAFAQSGPSKSPLIGTWLLGIVDNVMPDGSRVHLYGDNPQGLLTFSADGRYSLQIMRSDRARFVSNDRARATAEEYKSAVMGSNAHFGRYVLNDTDHTITFRIEHASFPNWEGTEQKRSYKIEDGRLKYIVPTPTTGAGAIGEVEWKLEQ